MAQAFVVREEVHARVSQMVDPQSRRVVPGSVRAVYVALHSCLPTSGPEARKPENERILSAPRSELARITGYSERTITRAIPALVRVGGLEVVRSASTADVYLRRPQLYTLPLAPRGHWRRIVPKPRDQRTFNRMQARTPVDFLAAPAPHFSSVQETKRLPLPPRGGEGVAFGSAKADRGDESPRKPPLSEEGTRGRSPATPPPSSSRQTFDPNAWLSRFAESDRLRRYRPSDPDPDRNT